MSEKELLVVENINVAEVFSKGGMVKLLEGIEKQVVDIVPILDTVKGRKEVASLARMVSSSKVLIDSVGKDLVSEWKEKSKIVDGERKVSKEFLDNLRDKIRKPLTEWEDAEQERVEAESLKIEIEACHVEALDYNKYLTDKAAMEAKQAELEAKEAELNAKAEAQQKKEDDAEAEAEAEKDRIENEEKEREQALEDERLKVAAEMQAEIDRKKAEKQAEADRKAMQVRADAQAQENAARKIAEQIEKDRAAQEKREANKRHVNKINKEAVESLVIYSSDGINIAEAKAVIKAIAEGLIPNVTINY